MTPAEVAEDYQVPIEAVYEAVEYCEHNDELLRAEREDDRALLQNDLLVGSPVVRAKP